MGIIRFIVKVFGYIPPQGEDVDFLFAPYSPPANDDVDINF